MAEDAVDAPSVRVFLAAAMRLAVVAVDDASLAQSLPLLAASLADWPRLTRAARPGLEPMPGPGRSVAGS